MEKFWDFSVQIYGQEGVSAACLALQNERGADINLILFCCWYAMWYGLFTDQLVDSALLISHLWARKVVQPLRDIRTCMKLEVCPDVRITIDNCIEMREKIKNLELEAEQIQQEMLETLCNPVKKNISHDNDLLETIGKNLLHYCRAESIKLTTSDYNNLALIMTKVTGCDNIKDAEKLLVGNR